MSYAFSLQTILWLATQVLQAAIVVALFKRGLHRRYRWFTAYIALELVSDPFLAFARGTWDYTYYFGYWITVIGTTVLTVCVLNEVVQHVWPSSDGGRTIGRALVWLIVAVVIVQSGTSLMTLRGQGSYPDQFTELILLADRDVKILALGVTVFVLVFRQRLGRSWREFSVGIVAGFALFSLAHLAIVMAMAHQAVIHRRTLGAMNSGAYLVAELIWLGYAILSPMVTFGGSGGGMGSGGSSPRGRAHAFMGLRWKQYTTTQEAQ